LKDRRGVKEYLTEGLGGEGGILSIVRVRKELKTLFCIYLGYPSGFSNGVLRVPDDILKKMIFLILHGQ
jgi:hypothetical protein